MSQRYAIIDLGTNTFHLLIASKGQSGFLDVQQRQQRPVKLMSNGFTEGQIPQDAYDRGIEAIRAFSRELEAQHAQLIKVLGTSALRSADNALSFLNRAETLLNCPVSLIDGDEEATYIYHGTREAVGLGRAYSLILDIGGGSVEFIIGNKDGLAWKRSLEIGAARLIARFPHDFPMTAEQKQAVRSYLDEQLSPVLPAIQAYQPADLIGASGYFETFVNLEYQEVRSDKIGQMPLRYELTLDRFQPNHSGTLRSSGYGSFPGADDGSFLAVGPLPAGSAAAKHDLLRQLCYERGSPVLLHSPICNRRSALAPALIDHDVDDLARYVDHFLHFLAFYPLLHFRQSHYFRF